MRTASSKPVDIEATPQPSLDRLVFQPAAVPPDHSWRCDPSKSFEESFEEQKERLMKNDGSVPRKTRVIE